ncbi:hypothetical protein PSHT_01121 [Puccinia striiformis]|uniref:Prephenate/arogenate dehydrogenase domain-containing protein n=1 Tax=Puccinia striiformis TaxID=27350 RepID=A0A2S4WLQ1_9BASI|nr:hypothetical protein PSHT_01121 [Puccinia striiformis]
MNASPKAVVVGLIGMGEMGRMLLVCDRPEKFDQLREDYKDQPNVRVVANGHLVSRSSDLIIYSVDSEHIEAIVEQYGPSTKLGAIVAGQTSVKAPEQAAFEKYLPSDARVCSIHSLHAPSIPPDGQALVLIPFRCSIEEKESVMEILAPLRSRYVELSYEEHDVVMANTQACTHAAFLSSLIREYLKKKYGNPWHATGRFPWDSGRYIGGIEVAKINITLRIYSSKWHVYAGLAILNPIARVQIDQFARSVTELFVLMVSNDEEGLRKEYMPVEITFAIGEPAAGPSPPNSHLTILAIVDCWHQLGLNPFIHLDIAATPVFRLWFGLIHHLYDSPERLDKAIHAAVHNLDYRADDCEFVLAARGWSQCISYGDFKLYQDRFQHTSEFFKPRIEEDSFPSHQPLLYSHQVDAALKYSPVLQLSNHLSRLCFLADYHDCSTNLQAVCFEPVSKVRSAYHHSC